MIKESKFSDIKKTIKYPRAFYYDYESISFDVINYISKNISMLGLYLSYLELNGIEYQVDCRPNNKFYINKCFKHKSWGNDYPFTIIENDGLFACRGCWNGGHIIDFVGEAYKLSSDEILKILFSYINGTYDELSDTEKNIYDQLFYRYSLKDKYISISKEKQQKLDNRIKRYIESSKKEINYFKIAQRLGCSSEYVKRFIENQNIEESYKEEIKMDLTQFRSFKELISTPVSEGEYNQILQMIEEIYNTSFDNQTWIGVILEFLNDNTNDKYYSEYYLTPDLSYGTRKYTYRFISTEENMPHSITDADIQVLKKFNARPQFILYDYEEQPSADIFAYLEQHRTLRKVLESIGMTEELKEHLCEYCFYRIKEEKHQARLVDLGNGKVWNPDLWKPIGFKPVEIDQAKIMAENLRKTNSFLDYQAPEDRYEVRGIMPSSKNKTLELTPPKPIIQPQD